MVETDMSFGNSLLFENKTSKKAVPKYGNVWSKDMAGYSLAGIFSTNYLRATVENLSWCLPYTRESGINIFPRAAAHNLGWLELESNSIVVLEICMKHCSVVAGTLHSLLICWKTWPKSRRFDGIVRKLWLTFFAVSAVAGHLVATCWWFAGYQ